MLCQERDQLYGAFSSNEGAYLRLISATIQLAFTNLKSAMETSEQCEICSKSTIKTPERHTKWSNTLKQFV